MCADKNPCGSPDFCLDDGGCACGIPGNRDRVSPRVTLICGHDTEEPAFLCASGNERCPTLQACAEDPDNCMPDVPHIPIVR